MKEIDEDQPLEPGTSTDAEDAPASRVVMTRSGGTIDVNNLPGRKRIELVATGEMGMEAFNLPPNMPGKKLKPLREQIARQWEAMRGGAQEIDGGGSSESSELKVGDEVIYTDGEEAITTTVLRFSKKGRPVIQLGEKQIAVDPEKVIKKADVVELENLQRPE